MAPSMLADAATRGLPPISIRNNTCNYSGSEEMFLRCCQNSRPGSKLLWFFFQKIIECLGGRIVVEALCYWHSLLSKKKWHFPTPIKVPMIAKQIHFFSLSIFHLKQYFKHFFPFLFFLPSLSPSLVPPSLTPLHLLYAIPSFLPSFPSHHWTPTQTIIPSSPLTSKSSFLYFHSFISFPCFFSLTFFLLPSFRPLKKAGCRESHFWNKRTMFSWRGRCF